MSGIIEILQEKNGAIALVNQQFNDHLYRILLFESIISRQLCSNKFKTVYISPNYYQERQEKLFLSVCKKCFSIKDSNTTAPLMDIKFVDSGDDNDNLIYLDKVISDSINDVDLIVLNR
jgi:hypothetical protein